MGIDVFGRFQATDGERWIFLEDYYDGRRGLLRWWLGWGTGPAYEKFGLESLVDEPLGLPTDYFCSDLDDNDFPSWLNADEILGALPLIGRYTYFIPQELVRVACEQKANPKQWKAMTGISDELDFLERYGGVPRLISVEPKWEVVATLDDFVPVDGVYDFSDEISEFTSLVAKLQEQYGVVRFVYGFG